MNTHVVPVIVRTERLERARNRPRLELAALRLSRILGSRFVRAEGGVPDVHLTEILQVDDGKRVVFRSHVEFKARQCARCANTGWCTCPYCASECHTCHGAVAR